MRPSQRMFTSGCERKILLIERCVWTATYDYRWKRTRRRRASRERGRGKEKRREKEEEAERHIGVQTDAHTHIYRRWISSNLSSSFASKISCKFLFGLSLKIGQMDWRGSWSISMKCKTVSHMSMIVPTSQSDHRRHIFQWTVTCADEFSSLMTSVCSSPVQKTTQKKYVNMCSLRLFFFLLVHSFIHSRFHHESSSRSTLQHVLDRRRRRTEHVRRSDDSSGSTEIEIEPSWSRSTSVTVVTRLGFGTIRIRTRIRWQRRRLLREWRRQSGHSCTTKFYADSFKNSMFLVKDQSDQGRRDVSKWRRKLSWSTKEMKMRMSFSSSFVRSFDRLIEVEQRDLLAINLSQSKAITIHLKKSFHVAFVSCVSSPLTNSVASSSLTFVLLLPSPIASSDDIEHDGSGNSLVNDLVS